MKLNIRDPKVQLAALGAAGVVAFALYRSKSGGGVPGTIGNPTGAASALGDANLQSAVYDSLEAQYTGLAKQVASLSDSRFKQLMIQRRAASPAPSPTPGLSPARLIEIKRTTPIVQPPAPAVHASIPTPTK